MNTATVVATYKSLGDVERDSRSIKAIDLDLRPILLRMTPQKITEDLSILNLNLGGAHVVTGQNMNPVGDPSASRARPSAAASGSATCQSGSCSRRPKSDSSGSTPL